MPTKINGRRSEVRTLRSWLEVYAYQLPFSRPWYLASADAQDVMGQVWLNIIAGGHLGKEVSLGYLIQAARNEIRRRGLDRRAEGAAGEALFAEARSHEECVNDDFMAMLQRRINLRMAAAHLQERHLRSLELTLEGYSSAEVSDLLRIRHGWHVTAATVRKWHERHINSFYLAQAA